MAGSVEPTIHRLGDVPARVSSALSRAASGAPMGSIVRVHSGARRDLVVGDPQASAHQFFTILSQHGLIADDGWLEPDVQLTSIGDHFDFGSFEQRREAARSGLAILSWLAAHDSNQVTLIAGNHDLSRVAELYSLDDDTFQRAATEAHELYRRAQVPADAERDFLERYPMFPSVEVAARDLCCFEVRQRELVTQLLLASRFRLAASRPGVLLVHAGATKADVERAGVPVDASADADRVASALNRVLDEAVAEWNGTDCFQIPGFFVAGSAAAGEPGGFLFQRPAKPGGEIPDKDKKRRYDPRELPLGLTQVIGHVRDPKCRALLRDWVSDAPGDEGPLRHLESDGRAVTYAFGPPRSGSSNVARLVFVDGGMNHVPAERYELLDLQTLSTADP